MVPLNSLLWFVSSIGNTRARVLLGDSMDGATSPATPRGLDDSVGSAANDPDMGHGLLQREVSRLEKEVASLKTKLRNAQDQIVELEKVRARRVPTWAWAVRVRRAHAWQLQEKEERYARIKAEVYENSMTLLHSFQRSHNDAQVPCRERGHLRVRGFFACRFGPAA